MNKQKRTRPTEGSRRLAQLTEKTSQADVAEKIGAHSGAVSRWVNNKRRPGVDALSKIEIALGIPARLWGLDPFVESDSENDTTAKAG
jgi:transcriptional regulator with XRE-family HTH domain